MSETQKDAEQGPPVNYATLLPDVAFVKKLVVVLLIACLAISACLNVYLLWQNRDYQSALTATEFRLQGYGQVTRLAGDVFRDLEALSKSDENAAKLLAKYERALKELGYYRSASGGQPGE